ncbi:TonB family protein [Brevundimonas sp.]|uniref:TonB family protein n=1 Tax=Brevundimonas sp. TaxID=1871086 RepID=UPI003D14CE6B
MRRSEPSADQFLLQSPAVETTCGGVAIQPSYSEDLRIETTRISSTDGRDQPEKRQVVLNFAVDAKGRTRDIRPASTRAPHLSGAILVPGIQSSDLEQAALAAWRFPGGPRGDCRMTISYSAKLIAEATKSDLLHYFAVTRSRGPIRNAVAERLAGPGANCGSDGRGGRAPRTLSYPDNRIGQRPPPGGRSWSVVRWNVSPDGATTDVETLGSSGDTAFDSETRRAVSESVVQSGAPLKGCVYNFYRNGERLPAPDLPTRDEDPLQVCPAEVGTRFQARGGPESFPRAFHERGIEGWALVRFDLATWGEVGNVEVIDAQPAAAFGDSARRTVQSGRAEPAYTAGVRCVVPVRYTMPETTTNETTSNDIAAD